MNAARFGGYSNWRLPTVKELSQLYDFGGDELSITVDFFPETTSGDYWTSTNYVDPALAWRVSFYYGAVNNYYKYGKLYVRAVRSAGSQSSVPLVDNGDGTVSDPNTGLMWQQYHGYGTWQDALAYCENLDLAGYDDWHTPDLHELQSLVDYSLSRPCIDQTLFPDTSLGRYWSSSTSIINFTDGDVAIRGHGVLGYSFNVRAVRSGEAGGTSSPLITSFTATPSTGIAPLLVNFICNVTDPDGGSIIEYRLDINNDGVIDYTTGNSNFSFTFTNPGDYQVKCTVVDDESETATSSLIYISVNQSGGAYTNGNYNYYIPYFRSGSGYWSGVGVSNSSEVNTSPLSITVYGRDGSVLATGYPNPLPVNGQIAQAVAGTLEATGWILINSHEELTGLSFFARSYMADVPFVDAVSKALMIPHVAQNEMWDTHLLICNPNPTPVTLTLTAYDQNGNVVATNISSLSAWGSDTYPFADTFSSLPALTGKVEVTVTQGDGVAAFALYMNQKSGGSYFAGINAVDISAPVVVTPF